MAEVNGIHRESNTISDLTNELKVFSENVMAAAKQMDKLETKKVRIKTEMDDTAETQVHKIDEEIQTLTNTKHEIELSIATKEIELQKKKISDEILGLTQKIKDLNEKRKEIINKTIVKDDWASIDHGILTARSANAAIKDIKRLSNTEPRLRDNARDIILSIAKLDEYMKSIGKRVPDQFRNLLNTLGNDATLLPDERDVISMVDIGRGQGRTGITDIRKAATQEATDAYKEQLEKVRDQISAAEEKKKKIVSANQEIATSEKQAAQANHESAEQEIADNNEKIKSTSRYRKALSELNGLRSAPVSAMNDDEIEQLKSELDGFIEKYQNKSGFDELIAGARDFYNEIDKLRGAIDTLPDDTTPLPIPPDGDNAILQWIDDLEKLEVTSAEAKESMKDALDISKEALDAGSSLELLTSEFEKISEQPAKKRKRKPQPKIDDSDAVVRAEDQSLEELAMLVANVTAAVEEKTRAFNDEGMVVDAVVRAESDRLSGLLTTLREVSDTMGELHIPRGEKLAWTDSLKKLDADKIQNASGALQKMYEAVSKLDVNDSNLVTSIDRILSKGKELDNLAKVLAASKKDIQNTANNVKASTDKDSKATYDKELTQRKELLRLQQEIDIAEAKEVKNLDEIRAKNQPIIQMLKEQIQKGNEKRKQDGLTSQQYRQNVEAEIRDINRRNEAELAGARAVTEERNKKQTENTIDEQIRDLERLRDSFDEFLTQKSNKLMPEYKDRASEQVDKLNKQIQQLSEKKIDLINSKDEDELNAAVAASKELIKDTRQVKSDATDAASKLGNAVKAAALREQITDFLTKNTKLSKEFRVELEALRVKLSGGQLSGKDLQDIAKAFADIKTQAKDVGDVGKSVIDTLKTRLNDMNAKFIAQFVSFQDVLRYIRTAVSTVTELDTALVDLKKTTTMTSSELEGFYRDSNSVAKQMGVTTAAIIDQASSWSRLGYQSAEAATEMAKVSSQFASISPGMDTTTAQEGLVSIMKGFDIEVSQAEREVLDNINAVGNAFAKSNDQIVAGLERSSSAMQAANNSLEETIGLFVAGQEITQDAEKMGNALRTISMRIRGERLLPSYMETYMP